MGWEWKKGFIMKKNHNTPPPHISNDPPPKRFKFAEFPVPMAKGNPSHSKFTNSKVKWLCLLDLLTVILTVVVEQLNMYRYFASIQLFFCINVGKIGYLVVLF